MPFLDTSVLDNDGKESVQQCLNKKLSIFDARSNECYDSVMIYKGSSDVLLTRCKSWFDNNGTEMEMKPCDL